MLRALAVVLCLSLVACDRPEGLFDSSAENTLKRYLDAAVEGDWTTAYDELSAADQAVRPLPAFVTAAGEGSGIPTGKTLVSYRILEVEETGDTATARVELEVQDVGNMLSGLWGNEFPVPAIAAADAETPKDTPAPTTQKTEAFALVREHESWKISLSATGAGPDTSSLDAAAPSQENQSSGSGGGPLGLDTAWSEAGKALDALARGIKSAGNAQAYMQKIELYELKAGYYRTALGKRVPGVEFKLRNRGERTLTKVAVTVYFKNAGGTIISEETFYPVLVSGHSFLDSKPLKPGYVWQIESGKFFVADAVPSEWQEGAVDAKITDLGYAEDAD